MDFTLQPQWDLPPSDAIAFQRRLAGLVQLDDRFSGPDLIAGVDLALGRFAGTGRAAIVVWRPADAAVVEELAVELPLAVPYIPGLLAFREGPLVEAALRQVRSEPDVVTLDGQGIAHPRGLGIAAHLGVLLDRAVIGVAKSRLFGRAEELGPNPGDRTPLLAPDGRPIGSVLRTRARSRPLYVSPGNHVSIETAADLVTAALRRHRLPEPTFLADQLSKRR